MAFDAEATGLRVAEIVRSYVREHVEGATASMRDALADMDRRHEARHAELERRAAAGAAEVKTLRTKAAEADALRAKLDALEQRAADAHGLRDAVSGLERRT